MFQVEGKPSANPLTVGRLPETMTEIYIHRTYRRANHICFTDQQSITSASKLSIHIKLYIKESKHHGNLDRKF